MALETLLARLRAHAALPAERAESLPSELYWRPDVYALEEERIFRRDWSCVGHVDQVRGPGDWLKTALAGEPLVITRDAAGALRALSRVCRHRAIDLLCESEAACGHAEQLECPYHLWTYALDGRLLGAPEMRGAPGFARSAVRLPEFRLETWQGYIFVCLDPDAPPLAPRLSELDALLGGTDMSGWRIAGTLAWGDVAVNWKVAMENAAECYHHLGTHRATLQPLWPANRTVSDETSSRDFMFGRLFTSEALAAGVEDGYPLQPLILPPAPGLSAELRAQTRILGIFPMFFLAVGPDAASWFQWHPTGPASHHLDIHVLVPPESFAAPEFDSAVKAQLEALRGIQAEDARTNAGVQRGLESRSAAPGRLAPLERPLWQFQRYLAHRLTGVDV